MQRVYVQNKDSKPLMPTTRNGAVRRWLKEGKAIVIDTCPFTIKLQTDCENKTQNVVVGLDTGAINVGCSAVNNNRCLYTSETKLRTDIHRKMLRRASYRRTRRSRKTRYRQVRFNNRKKPKGWLSPTLRSKANSTVKIVHRLSEIVPITKVIVEIAKFDIQKIKNPDIQGVEYQKGATEGYDNVRSFVFERDKYTCQICKKKLGILQTHHIIQRKDGGSNMPDNLATVHKQCHDDFHKGLIEHKFRKPKKYMIQTHVTTLKNFVVNELKKDFDVGITFGHITKRNRQRLNLPKSHCFDAVAICNPKKIERITHMFKMVCIPCGRYQQTKGSRSEKHLPSDKIFGFNQWDKVKIGKQIGFVKGRRKTGCFDICDIDNNNISHSLSYKKLKKLFSKGTMEVSAIPPTSKEVGFLAPLS